MYRLADNDKTLLICRDMNHKAMWRVLRRRNRIERIADVFNQYRKGVNKK